MINGNPHIMVFENEKAIPLQPEAFDKYKSWIMDSLNGQLKSACSQVIELFTISERKQFLSNGITVETNLDKGMTFFSGKVFLGNPPFNTALGKLINEVSSLTLTYNRPDEFLSIMQLPEMWALLEFIGADDHLTDLLIRAEKAYFDAVWDQTLNTRVWEMRRSIIAIVNALRAGKPIDLSKLILFDDYDRHGKEMKVEGTLYPCEKSEGREMSLFNYCNNEISLYLLYIILLGGVLKKVKTDESYIGWQELYFPLSSYAFYVEYKDLYVAWLRFTICNYGKCSKKDVQIHGYGTEISYNDIYGEKKLSILNYRPYSS